ncbi:hypothetical protein ADK52_34555 [Streptomyces sp. WM6372]|uniref:hypothetical protein n=1 Tax=Streptomyces sp. WM6372 TaxID=1415555 RepID=UPI0006AE0D81|nr:hypothetical protein [Streptomyces sp. WM6372]KOU15698.1 hypothetical protein ADK52_34555 [Streptomyces sp. WM6372]
MNTPSAASHAAEGQQKPGWFLTASLFGAANAVLGLADVWSWWALLWAPLLVLAVGSAAYEWRLSARSRWRMGPPERVLLAVSHIGCAASLTAIWLATH